MPESNEDSGFCFHHIHERIWMSCLHFLGQRILLMLENKERTADADNGVPVDLGVPSTLWYHRAELNKFLANYEAGK